MKTPATWGPLVFLLRLDKNSPNVGTGLVGAPACGDVMKLQIEVDSNNKITHAVFKVTYFIIPLSIFS
jgi:hypothetical protein